MERPIIDDHFVLKKGTEKGAWTFIEMGLLANVPKKKNGTVAVRGFIDQHEVKDFNIWSLKKGSFMAVNAGIRKAINKEEGDTVKLVLYLDEAPMVVADDFIVCLEAEPKLHAKFLKFTRARQKEIATWIFSAGTEDGKVQRIGQIMEHLETDTEIRLKTI